jgi:hypothetical protein
MYDLDMTHLPPFLAHIPERRLTVTTAAVGGMVITSIHELSTVFIRGRLPRHVGTVCTPLVAVDPYVQHEQVAADIRAGVYGDLSHQVPA